MPFHSLNITSFSCTMIIYVLEAQIFNNTYFILIYFCYPWRVKITKKDHFWFLVDYNLRLLIKG